MWFPSAVGYSIVRPMFELDVTAHYISQSPKDRSSQYIEYECVLEKKTMDVYMKHQSSNKPGWSEPLLIMWKDYWVGKQTSINTQYEKIRTKFEKIGKKGNTMPYTNWSGLSIHQMAIKVDHEEAYDVFYSDMSSFTHVDVRLANRYLRIEPDGIVWTQKTNEFEIGKVFRYAATFLDCFLDLFNTQFLSLNSVDIKECWNT